MKNQQRTNFTAQLIDGMNKMRLDRRLGHISERLKQHHVKLLHESVKFMLPDEGRLLWHDFKETKDEEELIRLPYPVTAIEYRETADQNKDEIERTGRYVEKTVILAYEIDRASIVELTEIIARFQQGFVKEESGIIIFGYDYWSGVGWMPCPYGLFKEYGDVSAIYLHYGEVGRLADDHGGYQSQKRNLDQYATIVYELCMVLNCENVTATTIPEPKGINARRKRKRKLPLYEYKVLELSTSKTSPNEDQGGHHNSPRVHLRRGHIRHLPPNRTRTTFVRACVVGKKELGVVMKDYAVV